MFVWCENIQNFACGAIKCRGSSLVQLMWRPIWTVRRSNLLFFSGSAYFSLKSSNFFVFESYGLRFAEFVCTVLIPSFLGVLFQVWQEKYMAKYFSQGGKYFFEKIISRKKSQNENFQIFKKHEFSKSSIKIWIFIKTQKTIFVVLLFFSFSKTFSTLTVLSGLKQNSQINISIFEEKMIFRFSTFFDFSIFGNFPKSFQNYFTPW